MKSEAAITGKTDSATAADIPQLCALLAILFAQEADFQPDVVKQAAALQQIIAQPHIGHILVWREDKEIVGMVSLLYSISTARGGKAAWLEDLVVRPARRGNGLGSALLQAAMTWAQQQGCMRITLLTDHSNDAAISFYQRHGFDKSAMRPLRLMLESITSSPCRP
ncbi:MAG TPA: GNAT family N-acetyltransferase [Gallionellaceae bacterium]